MPVYSSTRVRPHDQIEHRVAELDAACDITIHTPVTGHCRHTSDERVAYDGGHQDRAHPTMNPFQALSERGKPLHFAGRVPELALLDGHFAAIRDTADARAGMVLVTGVPGSGKTALCREFLDRHRGVDGAAALVVGVSNLDSASSLFVTMGRAIHRGLDFEHVRMTGGFHDMLRRSASDGLWENKSLAIFFDGLQNLEAEQAKTLRVLHEGAHGCPIMVIGAGLQHTRQVLAANGMTRVDGGVALGPLDRDATREAFAGALAELEIEPPTEIVERLAEASRDFPEHIQRYVMAARKLVGAPVGWRDPDTVDKVVREGDAGRAGYYDGRLEAMGDGHVKMIPVISHMRRAGVTDMSKRDAERVVTDAGEDNGKDVVAAAIQHGVLAIVKGDVSFGIPSFHSHMVDLHDQHLRRLVRQAFQRKREHHR